MSEKKMHIEEKRSAYGSITSSLESLPTSKTIETAVEKVKAQWMKVFIAYFLITLSMVLHCASITCVQVMGGVIPEFELNAWRFGLNFLAILPIVIARKSDLRVPRKIWPHVFVLMISANFFNLLYYASATMLPVGTVFALVQTVSIVGNALLSICIPRERHLPLYVGAIVVVIGIFLVTQPEFIFPEGVLPPDPMVNWTSPCLHQVSGHLDLMNNSSWNTTDPANLEKNTNIAIGYAAALSSGICNIIYFQLVCIVVSHIHPFVYTFWNTLACTTTSLVFMGIFETPMMVTGGLCVSLLLVHGFGTSQSTIIIPWCLQYLIPSIGNMVNSFQLVVLLILQYTALKDIQPGHNNWLEILGAAIVFVGVVGAPLWHLIKQRKAELRVVQVRDTKI